MIMNLFIGETLHSSLSLPCSWSLNMPDDDDNHPNENNHLCMAWIMKIITYACQGWCGENLAGAETVPYRRKRQEGQTPIIIIITSSIFSSSSLSSLSSSSSLSLSSLSSSSLFLSVWSSSWMSNLSGEKADGGKKEAQTVWAASINLKQWWWW